MADPAITETEKDLLIVTHTQTDTYTCINSNVFVPKIFAYDQTHLFQ